MCSLRGALDVFSHLCLRAATRGSAVVTSLWMWSSARWIKLPGSHSFHRAGTWLTQDLFSLKQSLLRHTTASPENPTVNIRRRFWSFPTPQPCPGMDQLQPLPSLEASFGIWASTGHLSAEIEVCHIVATALLFFLPCVYKKGRREFPHTRQACIFIASHPVNRKLLSLKRRSLVT